MSNSSNNNSIATPAAAAARWGAQPQWSNACFVSGLAIGVQLLTLAPAIATLWHVRSRFYVLLICIAACNVMDLAIDLASFTIDIPVSGIYFWAVVSWCNCCGFTFHNYWRLRGLKKGQQRWMVAGLGVLVCVTNAFYTLYLVDATRNWILYVWGPSSWYLEEGLVCNVWGVLDGVTNTLISGAFVQALSASDKETIGVPRGYTRMLYNIRWMLAAESVMMVSLAVVNAVQPSFDPLFLTFYLAEAIRLQIYIRFLHTLTRMLRRPTTLQLRSVSDMKDPQANASATRTLKVDSHT
ncbi:hypothetical protein RI367_001617 [Sorochytrium milnesiophthora]